MNTKDSQHENMDRTGGALSALAGLLVGGILGAGSMLLFAPQSGIRTRAQLRKGTRILRDQTSKTVNGSLTQAKSKANQIKADVQIRAEDMQHRGQDMLVKQLDRIVTAAEHGKKALQGS